MFYQEFDSFNGSKKKKAEKHVCIILFDTIWFGNVGACT